MKIIGMVENGLYICQVSHTELEKLTDKYYGKLPKLEVGSTMDLGAGYDFRSDIQKVCHNVIEATKSFGQTQHTLLKFAAMVTEIPEVTK